MKTELILKSDVLDIVFENRNKAYGAYDLRKFYGSRLMKSIGGMFAIVVVLSAFTFIPKKKVVADKIQVRTEILMGKTKEKVIEPLKPKEVQQPQQKVASQTLTTPTIVNKLETKILATITDTVDISNITQAGGPGNPPAVIESLPGGGDGPAPVPVETKINKEIPLETAEIMPSYPGGMEALRKFLQRNLTNPRDLEEGELVSVKMRFVVGYDGKLKNFETVEDGGQEFNKEVLRVLKKMPEWIPGKTKGQNVSVYYIIPVKFVPGN